MVISRLFVVLFIVGFETTNCVPVGKWDGDAKTRLLSLLAPTDDLPPVIEDPSIDLRNNFINVPSYQPSSYKSSENFIFKRDDNNKFTEPQKEGFKNGKFAIPWLNSQDEGSFENNDDSSGLNKDSSSENENEFEEFRQAKKLNRYEVREQRGESENNYLPPHTYLGRGYPQLFPGHNHGFGYRPGFYQGFGPHYHNNDFHHQHGPDCFGNRRRRPRPPQPPPTATPRPSGAPISIDPRVSTVAGIISTEAPGIDIRIGRDTRDREDRIIFPE